MHPNEVLLTYFYTCFQQKDHKGMQHCYSDDARFNDPVFTDLDAGEVRAMWEMLLLKARDLVISFDCIRADDARGSAEWVAEYTFSATGEKVVNRIHSVFEFSNGKISRHTDQFEFYNWARQALGFTAGLLLGWTPYIRRKIRAKAMKGLEAFMSARANQQLTPIK